MWAVDQTEESFFVYGHGSLADGLVGPEGVGPSGNWDVPYIYIGDGAKGSGPASSVQIYRVKLLTPTQLSVGIKFSESSGWSDRSINTDKFNAPITAVWSVGPVFKTGHWIKDELAAALHIDQNQYPVSSPDHRYSYWVDYCLFRQAVGAGRNTIPFADFSDEFDELGFMGKWQIQDQGTRADTYSNPGQLTLTLLGTEEGTGFGPLDAALFPVAQYPPPWEMEVRFTAPDDTISWNFFNNL
jgi:hypothetical protein